MHIRWYPFIFLVGIISLFLSCQSKEPESQEVVVSKTVVIVLENDEKYLGYHLGFASQGFGMFSYILAPASAMQGKEKNTVDIRGRDFASEKVTYKNVRLEHPIFDESEKLVLARIVDPNVQLQGLMCSDVLQGKIDLESMTMGLNLFGEVAPESIHSLIDRATADKR